MNMKCFLGIRNKSSDLVKNTLSIIPFTFFCTFVASKK